MSENKNCVCDGKQKVDAAAYPAFHVFEETDDWIAGILSDRREVDTEYGKMRVMTITQDDGTKSSISLSAQLAGLWEMDGKKVVIVYRGKVRNASGKGWTKQFEVWCVIPAGQRENSIMLLYHLKR